MKIEPLHINQIKASFEKMQTKEDLLQLLNEAKPLIYGEKTIPFDLKQLTWYANPKLSVKRYTEFKIIKKSGSERSIHAPVKGLKALQKTLSLILQCIFQPHQAAMGFVAGKSIVDNAKLHAGSKYVYNIDLKDFFPSVDQARVWKCLQLRPFNLKNDTKDSNRIQLANILAAICCTEMEVERKSVGGEWELVKRNVLPQGAPTSPVITNIVCQRLDYILTGVAKRFGLNYSRYADDITFSAMYDVFKAEGDFQKELQRIITEQGFHIKESKTRLQKDGYRKEVTGLLVNVNVNVQQRYIKQLRMWLYYWERYGETRAYNFFLQQYLADKGHIVKGKPNMTNVIRGKLDYLKMVKGGENELYLKLRGRFDKLTASNIESKTISEEAIATKTDTNQIKIILEVYQSPEKNEKLNKSIHIPKDTVLPSTIIVPNSIEEFEEVHEDNKANKLFPHNPMYTISFLKKFKMGDGSGFKELVHDVILSDETMQEILNKVKNHPNFIYHYKNEWISNVSYLNEGIVFEVRKLIDLFEQEGLPYFLKTGKHPFNNDQKYSDFGLKFKKSYRYGSGKEYSKLQSDIADVFAEMNLTKCNLQFVPSERIFNIRSNFFTWEPSIFKGLRFIFQGIRDHLNINGIALNEEKTIQIEAEDINLQGLRFLELRIIDFKSQANLNSEKLLHFLKESNPYKKDFRNLCDWIIECDFLEESPKRFNLLLAPEYSQSFQEIEELPNQINGFKHILRFYDVR